MTDHHFLRSRLRWALFAAVTGLLFLVIAYFLPVASEETTLAEADAAFKRGKFADAARLCDRILARRKHSAAALLLAGKLAARRQNRQAALEYLNRLPETGEKGIAQGWHEAAKIELQLGHASASEADLRRALAIDSGLLAANVDMAYLLGVEGRCWESVPYLMQSVRRGDFTFHHLVLLGASEPVIADPQLIEHCRREVPDDPVPLIGLARTALMQNDVSRAESLLRTVIAAVPDSVEAYASLGRVLVVSTPGRIPEWQADLPAAADEHPDVWSVRGEWAEQQSDFKAAVRCFWEAVRRDPNHRVANFRLGQLLEAMNEHESARRFVDRAEKLRQLTLIVDRLYAQQDKSTQFQRAAELCQNLGRMWEAWGWTRIALSQEPELSWAVNGIRRLQPELKPDLPRTLETANPAMQLDFTAYPLPRWPASEPGSAQVAHLRNSTPHRGKTGTAPASSEQVKKPQCLVRFRDVAAEVGVDFTYVNRVGSKNDAMRMMETTGGGVAVLDYDLNGDPDLYFTQGGNWPASDDQQECLDQLFRNDGRGRFARVTDAAGLGDPRYGQGATAGDFDNDGFSDLYVANIGQNRLYHNNGDGTFTDVSLSAGIRGALWTTSCLIADLNGDSRPDLYDVNYLSAESAANQICRRGDELHWCSPDTLDAEQDQVYLNRGNGEFENVTASAGIVLPNGKGMGIVAADFDDSGRLGLFIANDAVPNFLFVNQVQQRGDPIRFTEQAVPSGLAFDRDGIPQACMGVAVGDANGDGLFDLFITNFEHQSNTLYQQRLEFLFEDVTRQANLRDASYAMLGFGTQFIDGELDGWPDLILTNGHVLDLSYKGSLFEMPPQYYRNLGSGRFEEVSARTLGPFFEGKYLGRGLARLDWNRDGREDFVVSHMNSPAALVENQTPSSGHFLSIQLRGVQSSRDAIGTVVRATGGGRSWTQQLTGGDGYECANHRRIVFGFGELTTIDELSVRWPSGMRQSFRSISTDSEIIVIEGRSDPIGLPRDK